MNKRFISLFLAVLMLVTMIPINKVRAEDGEDSYINVNNGFKESMVIDDPANFEYLKYLAENYEFGTNDNMIT